MEEYSAAAEEFRSIAKKGRPEMAEQARKYLQLMVEKQMIDETGLSGGDAVTLKR